MSRVGRLPYIEISAEGSDNIANKVLSVANLRQRSNKSIFIFQVTYSVT